MAKSCPKLMKNKCIKIVEHEEEEKKKEKFTPPIVQLGSDTDTCFILSRKSEI